MCACARDCFAHVFVYVCVCIWCVYVWYVCGVVCAEFGMCVVWYVSVSDFLPQSLVLSLLCSPSPAPLPFSAFSVLVCMDLRGGEVRCCHSLGALLLSLLRRTMFVCVYVCVCACVLVYECVGGGLRSPSHHHAILSPLLTIEFDFLLDFVLLAACHPK